MRREKRCCFLSARARGKSYSGGFFSFVRSAGGLERSFHGGGVLYSGLLNCVKGSERERLCLATTMGLEYCENAGASSNLDL